MIKTEFITIQGAPVDGENPLPYFRASDPDTCPRDNGTLKPEELVRFGTDTGFRVLPYRMQDRYSRKKHTMELAAVVLENEFLRAEFLPGYGGRLYSLRDRQTGKELLYRNPVMQPANLAIRNAWFSGGIEWNIAQLGHTYSTCDKVFFARVETEDGYEFVRMYDYERTRGLLWQIDFHLPAGSRQLCAHVTIINDTDTDVSMYWWTNIAAKEEPGCRVFSGTREVLYIEPKSLTGIYHSFGHGALPDLPVIPGKDASYPESFYYSSEYFFQNPTNAPAPWEAIAYRDGSVFFERSTQPLRIRKMFCWGNHSGGRTWRDYLAVPGKGDYVEIQAGLAPTQLHTTVLEAHGVISFTQCFGGLSLEPGDAHLADYTASQMLVKTAVNAALSPENVEKMDAHFQSLAPLPVTKILYSGQGWGALEQARRIQEDAPLFPQQFSFPAETLTEEQQNWIALLWDTPLESLDGAQVPPSFLTDPAWLPYLEARLTKEPHCVTALLLKGVLLYENDDRPGAVRCWETALAQKELPILFRCLAQAAAAEKDYKKAVSYMEMAQLEKYPEIDRAFYEEYFQLLLDDNREETVFSLYQELPASLSDSEALLLETCEAANRIAEAKDTDSALRTQAEEFLEQAFQREYAIIREGETRIIDIWFSYAKRHQIPETEIPKHLDMRLT